MTALNNKQFKKLLSDSVKEVHYMGEVEIFNESECEFRFTYDANNDAIIGQGEIQLTDGQIEQVCAVAYEKHIDEQPEENNSFNGTPDYYNEYGLSEQMFV